MKKEEIMKSVSTTFGKVSVKLLETQDKWFGVTYKEDKTVVVESFAKLIEDGVYKNDLFSDLQA